ncbi:MAG: hypothetical protein AAF569_01095, partial [Pseudomonadota bacterium]
IKDIDEFFDSMRDMTFEESQTEEGIEKIKNAFRKFLTSQRCWCALHNFEKLCEEKSNKPFRADKETYNIMHEIRNCARRLSYLRNGFIPWDKYCLQGGLDADLMARIRHDSIEDYGESFTSLYDETEIYLHGLDLEEAEHIIKIQQARIGASTADLMSRKDAKRDNLGRIMRDPETKKIIKVERYDGDTGVYFRKMIDNILALTGKYDDRGENVDTRVGVFSLADNEIYDRETHGIYGLEAYDEEAVERWPEFEDSIRCADDSLGVSLLVLKGINRYKGDTNLKPKTASPFRLGRYLPGALLPFQNTPMIFHPIAIMNHTLERDAKTDPRMRPIIDKLIMAPIQQGIQEYGLQPVPGIPANDNLEVARTPVGGTSSLPGDAARAPSML